MPSPTYLRHLPVLRQDIRKPHVVLSQEPPKPGVPAIHHTQREPFRACAIHLVIALELALAERSKQLLADIDGKSIYHSTRVAQLHERRRLSIEARVVHVDGGGFGEHVEVLVDLTLCGHARPRQCAVT